MTRTEFYETLLQKLRNDLIQDIIDFVKKQKANELSLNNPIPFQEIDDQFSQTIDSIKVNGDVSVCLSYGENYDWDLTEFR
jgi:alanine-alpha-ketoisovalerate/valine-pyruvate aminotransferase